MKLVEINWDEMPSLPSFIIEDGEHTRFVYTSNDKSIARHMAEHGVKICPFTSITGRGGATILTTSYKLFCEKIYDGAGLIETIIRDGVEDDEWRAGMLEVILDFYHVDECIYKQ